MALKQFINTILGISLVVILAACTGTSGTTPTADSAATKVASTMSSFSATASAGATVEDSHAVPGVTASANAPVAQVHRASIVTADGSLWLWTDGTSEAVQVSGVTNAERSFVSPDGSLIAFTRKIDDTTYDLAVVNADGSNLRTLISSDQFNAMGKPDEAIAVIPNQVAWIPGTHTIAFNGRYQYMGPGLVISPSLLTINVDTGAAHMLFSEEESWQFWFSPDGSKIAVSLPDGINLYNSDGSRAAPSKFVTYPQVNTASEYQWTAEITWKSDSSAFAFIVPPAEPWVETPGDTDLRLIPANGFSVTTIFSGPILFLTPQAISPDLSQFVFLERVDPQNNQNDLHLVSFTDSTDSIYASQSDVSLIRWSPDNQSFLYSMNTNGVNQPFLGKKGSAPESIQGITSLVGAQWIDANRFLLLDRSDSGWKIWLGSIGSAPSLIFAEAASSNAAPQFHAN